MRVTLTIHDPVMVVPYVLESAFASDTMDKGDAMGVADIEWHGEVIDHIPLPHTSQKDPDTIFGCCSPISRKADAASSRYNLFSGALQ
jgi:hypothetical protein